MRKIINKVLYSWPYTRLETPDDVFRQIRWLETNTWISRGQTKHYNDELIPLLDRKFTKLNRKEKLQLETESIDSFRKAYSPYNVTEKEAVLQSKIHPLMIMQHYGIPTRFLDWSKSPYNSLYFAVGSDKELGTEDSDEHDGELWAFSYQRYLKMGSRQWDKYPETKGYDGIFNQTLPILFSEDGPNNDWFVLQFAFSKYGFYRLEAQDGGFSVTSKFGMDHALIIAKLLANRKYFHRFIIPKEIKRFVRKKLNDEFFLSYDRLFPDVGKVVSNIKSQVFFIK